MNKAAASSMAEVATDAPIAHPTEDVLQRAEFAQQIAESILRAPSRDGLVIALYGPWGSGKTSVLNLVRHYLKNAQQKKEIVVSEFRPWWFSGQEQLIQKYFHHLWAVFRKPDVPQGLEKLGDAFECLGNFFDHVSSVPLVPSATNWVGKLFMAFSYVFSSAKRARQMDLDQLREVAVSQLAQSNSRLLVVIDDIDRLTAKEMRQMFQVVKAVGSFPNTIYLLSFDYAFVERALDKVHKGYGRDYLEKIVQVPFELPQPDHDALHRYFLKALEGIIGDPPDHLWLDKEWSGFFHDCIAPYLSSLRSVKRLINRLRVSYPLIAGELNATEFILFQTLQVFEPALAKYISDNWKDFAESDLPLARDDVKDEDRAAKARRLLDPMSLGHRRAAEEALDKLFPRWKYGATEDGATLHEWRKTRRIRHPAITRRYFMLQVPTGDISDAEMSDILSAAGDVEEFANRLRGLAQTKTPSGLTRVHVFLEKLQDFTEQRIPREHIPTVIRALLVVGDDLLIDTDRAGFFGYTNDTLILRIIHQLVKRYRTQQERFEVLLDAVARGTALYSIVHEVGVRGQEHGKFTDRERLRPENERSVSADHLAELEKAVLQKIRSAAADGTLVRVPRLGSVLFSWKEWGGIDEPRQFGTSLAATDEGFVSLIVGCAGRTSHAGSDGYREWWAVNVETISEFTGLSAAQAEARAKALIDAPPAWLSAGQLEILRAFVAGLHRPKNAVGDPLEDET